MTETAGFMMHIKRDDTFKNSEYRHAFVRNAVAALIVLIDAFLALCDYKTYFLNLMNW